MSECVVRMEKPVNCLKCPLKGRCELFCEWANTIGIGTSIRKQYPQPFDNGCLILAVLPEKHGRLVDADERFLGVIHFDGGGFANYNTTIAERIGEEAMRMVNVIAPATEGGKHEAD